MTTLALSPFPGIVGRIEERTFTSVVSVSEDNIATVQKTIECWQETVTLIRDELNSQLRTDPSSNESLQDLTLIKDFQGRLGAINRQLTVVLKIPERLKILLAFDSLGEIQGIACCGMDSKKELVVGDLISAPSNLRWKTKLISISSPIYGAGTLLMHAIFKIAERIKKPKVGLYSIASAAPFYEKLGMIQDPTGFEFILSEKSHHENIERALAKALGPSFKYSLLY